MNNQVALWAGTAAFFGSLLAVGIFDLIDRHGWYDLIASMIVAGITAGAVYSKQRLDDAKRVDRGRDERMERLP